jgi:cytochrome P450
MRALVNQAFTPRMVQSWEEKIGSLVDRLLEKVDNTKSFDLINTLAYPLPLTVIAHLIGVHQEDLEMFRSWTLQIVGAPENNTPEAIQKNTERIHNGFKNLSQYFSDIIKEKREKPQDDIISVLLSAEVEGNKLKDEDIVAFSCLLLIAGHETTTNLIGNSLFCFLDDERRHWAYLQQNSTQIDAALEEVLRFRSPVQALPRTVKEDTKIGDIHFSAGDQLVLWIGSANRDEKQFPHANQFLIDRSPNQHLAFGKGIHFCLGAPLSKLEVKVVLLKLLHRFPSLQIERYKPLQSPLMYGLKEFYVSV